MIISQQLADAALRKAFALQLLARVSERYALLLQLCDAVQGWLRRHRLKVLVVFPSQAKGLKKLSASQRVRAHEIGPSSERGEPRFAIELQ